MLRVLGVSFVITFGLRAVPYVLFGGRAKLPDWLDFLGRYLPPAIMASLVVYAAKDVFLLDEGTMPLLLALGATVGVHLLRRNTALSIVLGTAVYMVLLRIL